MKAFRIAVTAILLTAPSAGLAQPGDDPAASDTEAEAPLAATEVIAPSASDTTDLDAMAKQEKKICRSEKMTGSLTRVKRICMTQRQWAEISQGNAQTLDRMGRSANQAQAANTTDAARAAAQSGL